MTKYFLCCLPLDLPTGDNERMSINITRLFHLTVCSRKIFYVFSASSALYSNTSANTIPVISIVRHVPHSCPPLTTPCISIEFVDKDYFDQDQFEACYARNDGTFLILVDKFWRYKFISITEGCFYPTRQQIHKIRRVVLVFFIPNKAAIRLKVSKLRPYSVSRSKDKPCRVITFPRTASANVVASSLQIKNRKVFHFRQLIFTKGAGQWKDPQNVNLFLILSQFSHFVSIFNVNKSYYLHQSSALWRPFTRN